MLAIDVQHRSKECREKRTKMPELYRFLAQSGSGAPLRTAAVDWNDSQPTRGLVESQKHHPGDLVMPQVRFAWSAQLVDVRRQACPRARWNAQQRAWTMTDADAKTFLAAGHSRLDMVRESSEVAIDGERWIIGFFQGAPCRRA